MIKLTPDQTRVCHVMRAVHVSSSRGHRAVPPHPAAEEEDPRSGRMFSRVNQEDDIIRNKVTTSD